jgi:hypothetical protein
MFFHGALHIFGYYSVLDPHISMGVRSPLKIDLILAIINISSVKQEKISLIANNGGLFNIKCQKA